MSKPLKIIFAGTPEFAVPSLQALIDMGADVTAVYTQPDRRAGRGRKLTASPVKALALAYDIPVFQPINFRDPIDQDMLSALNADLMVVVAYGLLLPKKVLAAPRMGCINVHASLLPRWRGAAPIQRAVLAGDKETGICIMQMDEGLDTGAVLNRITCPIREDDTSETLLTSLSTLGAEALLMTIRDLQAGRAKPQVQDSSLATYAGKIMKQEALIDWHAPASVISRQVRAYQPWPIAHTQLGDQLVKIYEAKPCSLATAGANSPFAPGTIIEVSKNGIIVATGDGALCITALQLPGTKVLSIADVMNSRRELFQPSHQFMMSITEPEIE